MDVRFNFLVTICVVLQVTWSASGLRLPLCNITSKSVPFKAPPKSPIIENATPFQVGPPCPKCASILSSKEPYLQVQAKISEETLSSPNYPSNPTVSLPSSNGILSSSNLLKKPSNADISLNPSLLELSLTQSMLKNSPNNLETFPMSPISNTPSISGNNVVNRLTSIDNLLSSKSENAIVQNNLSNAPVVGSMLSYLPRNILNAPLKTMETTIGNNIASQNLASNNTSGNIGNILNLTLPYDQSYVVSTGVTRFVSPQNIVSNKPAATSLNFINPNNFDSSFSEHNIASPNFTITLYNSNLNSRQNNLVINAPINQGTILNRAHETNQGTNSSPNEATNNNNILKLSSLHAGTSYSKSPLVNIPLDSNVQSLNTVSTPSLVITDGNFKNQLILEESRAVPSTKSQRLPLISSAPSLYTIPNQIPQVLIPDIPNVNDSLEEIINSNRFKKVLRPQNNVINTINTVNPSNSIDFSNMDVDLWATILNQLRNPVTIKNNEKNIPKTSNNNSKSIRPLPASNNLQIMDFYKFNSPFFTENYITSSQLNNLKTTTSPPSPMNIDNNQNDPDNVLSIPSIENNEIEKEQKLASIRRTNSLLATQSSAKNSIKPSISPALLSPVQNVKAISNNDLQSGIPLKPTKSLPIDSNSINNNVKSLIFPSAVPSVDYTKAIKPDLIPTKELYSPFSNLKLYKPFDHVRNKSENTLPRAPILSSSTFIRNEDTNYNIDKINGYKINSETTSNGNLERTPAPNLSSINSNRLKNDKTLPSKPFVKPSNNVSYKQPNSVATTSNPEVSSIPSTMSFFPSSNLNNELPLNNFQLHNTGSSTSSNSVSSNPSIIYSSVKNGIVQNPSIVNKASTENNFAQFIQNSNLKSAVAENVVIGSDIPEKSQISYFIPLVTKLPKVNAPNYAQPQTVINYANILPKVPQIGNLVSTSEITRSLNALAAEVVRKYFSLVGQKPTYISSPLLRPIPITNAAVPKVESVSTSQSETSNTPSAIPISTHVSNHLSPNPCTANNSIDTSSMPTSSPYVTDSVSLHPTTSLPIISPSQISSKEKETSASRSLIPYLSSLTINVIPEEVPQETVIPTYLPAVDYQFLPSPTYPVPSYPFPSVFPTSLPSIIEAPVLKMGCKESHDFKKILEILVLNELINKKNECKDWGTIETIIALLCAT